jgi:hypothetical protein
MPDGTLCGWTRDGRALDCAAHRKRMQLHGDYLAHVPVTRKPSRKPADVAARRAMAAQRAAIAIKLRDRAAERALRQRLGTLELA